MKTMRLESCIYRENQGCQIDLKKIQVLSRLGTISPYFNAKFDIHRENLIKLTSGMSVFGQKWVKLVPNGTGIGSRS